MRFKIFAFSLLMAAIIILFATIYLYFPRASMEITNKSEKSIKSGSQPMITNMQEGKQKNISNAATDIEKNTLGRAIEDAQLKMSQNMSWKKTYDKINGDVHVLKQESTVDSLENLKKVSLYFWPGAQRDESNIKRLPLMKNVGRFDIETIMSNRRFLKLYTELKRLDDNTASIMLSAEIKKSFNEYQNLYDQLCREEGPHYPASLTTDKPTVGLIFQIEDGEDNSTLFLGARFKVLSLLFLSAQLHLKSLHNEVMELIRYAKEQRDNIYNDKNHHFIYKCDLLQRASLYNRQILATAALLTSQSKIPAYPEMQSKKLTTYDAELTTYDQPSRIGAIPVDYSKGEITSYYFSPIDDMELEKLIDQAG